MSNTTVPQNVSTQRNKYKSQAWKDKKRQRGEENRKLRADLHASKAKRDMGTRVSVQAQIDMISKRG